MVGRCAVGRRRFLIAHVLQIIDVLEFGHGPLRILGRLFVGFGLIFPAP